jgi:hypothetical protein
VVAFLEAMAAPSPSSPVFPKLGKKNGSKFLFYVVTLRAEGKFPEA